MPEEEITTPDESLSEEETSDGNEGADSQDGLEALSLTDLNKTLGKEFPTKEAALKSIKDTYSYVGKKKEDIQKELSQEDKLSELSKNQETLQKQLADANFYAENPEYKNYKDLINRFGENPAEVVKDKDFLDTFNKLKAHDEAESSKSILQTNPKLGKLTDKMSNANKKLADGDTDGAKNDAVDAVVDLLGI